MFTEFKIIITKYLVYSKKKFRLFLILSLLLSCFQIFGVISIYPIVTMIISPEIILKNSFFIKYYPFSFQNNYTLLVQFSFIFLFLNVVSFLTIIINNVLTETLSTEIKNKLKINFFQKVLNAKSLYSVNLNKSEFINQSQTEIENINTCLSAFLYMLQSIIIFLGYITLLVFIEYKIIVAFFLVTFFYVLVFSFNKKILNKIHFRQIEISKNTNKILVYINLALKDLILLDIGKKILKNLSHYQNDFLNLNVKKLFIGLYPRQLLELIIYLLVMFYALFYYENLKNLKNINLIALLIFLLWRSIPYFYQLYKHVQTFNTYKISLNNFLKFEKKFLNKKKK